MTERLLTLIEVSDLLRVSPHTIRAWVRKGRLRPVRICRRLLFDPAEVSRFLADAKIEGGMVPALEER
jgi:excisionase family DNA binding protein